MSTKEATKNFYYFKDFLKLPESELKQGPDILALGERAEDFIKVYQEKFAYLHSAASLIEPTAEQMKELNWTDLGVVRNISERLASEPLFDRILVHTLFNRLYLAQLLPDLLDHLKPKSEIRIALHDLSWPLGFSDGIEGIPRESKIYPGYFDYDGMSNPSFYLVSHNGQLSNLGAIMAEMADRPDLSSYTMFSSLDRRPSWRRARVNYTGVLAIRNDSQVPVFTEVNRDYLKTRQNEHETIGDPNEEVSYLGIPFKIDPHLVTPEDDYPHFKIAPALS